MTRNQISILSLALALILAGCSESKTEQQSRLNQLADEIVEMPDGEQTEALAQLSSEDLEEFSLIMSDRLASTQASLVGGSALTQKMLEYAAIDSGKADRLVAQCAGELGVSAVGEDAPLIAECVDQNW